MSLTGVSVAEQGPRKKGGRKRKIARQAELIEAATAEFVEKGYAGARLEDVAVRLGIVRSTIYRYCADKEELFRAVVVEAIAPNVEALRAFRAAHSPSLTELLSVVVGPMTRMAVEPPLAGVLKIVIGEAGNFPELARIWHDQLMAPTLDVLSEAIVEAQRRGEVRAGDPRAFAFQLLSPLIMTLIWRKTLLPAGAPDFDVHAFLQQCVETFLSGVLTDEPRATAVGG